jgi:hypothetical protein
MLVFRVALVRLETLAVALAQVSSRRLLHPCGVWVAGAFALLQRVQRVHHRRKGYVWLVASEDFLWRILDIGERPSKAPVAKPLS